MESTRILQKRLLLCLSLCAILLFTACDTPETDDKAETSETTRATTTTSATTESLVSYETTYTAARTYTNSIGTVWAQVIVEITNTGSVPLYLGSAAYDLEDNAGKLVATGTYVSCFPDVINPGEKGYMYDETIVDNLAGGLSLKVLPRIEIEAATVTCLRMQTSEVTITDDNLLGIKTMGRVENTTNEAHDYIYVVAVYYDASNNPIGLAFTIISENITVGSKVGFEFYGAAMPDDVTAASVANYIIYAYPHQFQY